MGLADPVRKRKIAVGHCCQCGREFTSGKRVGRRRLFCSYKCRDEARRNRNFVGSSYPSGQAPRNSEPGPFVSDTCKGENRDRAPLNILGGSPWSNAVRIEPDLRRRIVLVEIGGA
jgi:hypothetical protein